MSAEPANGSRCPGVSTPRATRLGGLLAGLLVLLPVACVPGAPDDTLPTTPTGRYSLSIAWNAPSTDAMGNSLDDLVGFRLYHGPSTPPSGPGSTVIEVGNSTSYTVTNLEAGIHYFAVTAIDEAGNESEPSGALSVEVGGS